MIPSISTSVSHAPARPGPALAPFRPNDQGFLVPLLVLCIGIVSTLVWQMDYLGLSALPLALIGLLCMLPLFIALGRGELDLFEPIYLYIATIFLEYFIKPIATIVSPEFFGLRFFPIDYDSPAVPYSLMVSACGILAFLIAYYWSSLPEAFASKLPRLSAPWSPRRSQLVMIVCACVFFLLIYYFFQKGGFSLSYMFLNRARISANDSDKSYFLRMTGWFFAAIAFGRLRASKRVGTLSWIRFGATILVIAACFSIFGSRMTTLFVPATTVVVWHYAFRRLNIRGFGLILASLFFVSSLFGAFRGSLEAASIGSSRLAENLGYELTGYHDWDVLVGVVEHYPLNRDYYYGKLALGSLLWPIPRKFWTSKPIAYGPGLIQDDLAPGLRSLSPEGGYTGTSMTQSTIGEGYADFGFLGAVGYMFLFGLFWKTFFEYLRVNAYSVPAVALYAINWVALPIWVRGFSGPLITIAVEATSIFLVFKFLESNDTLARARA